MVLKDWAISPSLGVRRFEPRTTTLAIKHSIHWASTFFFGGGGLIIHIFVEVLHICRMSIFSSWDLQFSGCCSRIWTRDCLATIRRAYYSITPDHSLDPLKFKFLGKFEVVFVKRFSADNNKGSGRVSRCKKIPRWKISRHCPCNSGTYCTCMCSLSRIHIYVCT